LREHSIDSTHTVSTSLVVFSVQLFTHPTQVLRDTIREVVGDTTFQEAYDRTNRVINITVTPQDGNDWPRCVVGYVRVCVSVGVGG